MEMLDWDIISFIVHVSDRITQLIISSHSSELNYTQLQENDRVEM